MNIFIFYFGKDNKMTYAYQSLGTYNCTEEEFLELIKQLSNEIITFEGLLSKTFYYNTELKQGSVIYLCDDKEAALKAREYSHEILEKYPDVPEFYTEFIWKVNNSYNRE
jgi:hypothetical protein